MHCVQPWYRYYATAVLSVCLSVTLNDITAVFPDADIDLWAIYCTESRQCVVGILINKKYVLSNSGVCPMQLEPRDHVTFIQFKICCCVQNFMKIGWFFTHISSIYRFSKWRPSTICESFYHHTRPPTKSVLLAAAACQISCQSDTQIWRYSYLNFSHSWLEMPIHAP